MDALVILFSSPLPLTWYVVVRVSTLGRASSVMEPQLEQDKQQTDTLGLIFLCDCKSHARHHPGLPQCVQIPDFLLSFLASAFSVII